MVAFNLFGCNSELLGRLVAFINVHRNCESFQVVIPRSHVRVVPGALVVGRH